MLVEVRAGVGVRRRKGAQGLFGLLQFRLIEGFAYPQVPCGTQMIIQPPQQIANQSEREGQRRHQPNSVATRP